MSHRFSAPAIKATELVEAPRPGVSTPTSCYSTPWMLWWIVGVHICWGLTLLFDPSQGETLVVLVGTDWMIRLGLSALPLGILLLIVSSLAATGLSLEHLAEHNGRRLSIWIIAGLICPQYFVVLAAFISDINTLATGVVDGRNLERWLLLGALAPVVVGALLHTAAILERYALLWRRR